MPSHQRDSRNRFAELALPSVAYASPMTETVLCVKCAHKTAHLLPTLSEMARVDYYRCRDCGHVWTTVKGTKDLLEHISLPPVKPAS